MRILLEDGKKHLQGVNRIIAQPNIYAKVIREWAVSNGWKIIDEHILKEDGKIYEIIVLEKGIEHYDELELTVGPFLIAEKSDVFLEKWERESAEWKRVLQSLENADETDAIQLKKKQLITQIELVGKVLAT